MVGIRRWQVSASRLSAAVVFGALLLLVRVALSPQRPQSESHPLFVTHAVLAPAETSATTAIATPGEREVGVVYVNDIYVPGHARAHPELCPDRGAHLQLLILVTSAPSHASSRDAIRLTWGHYGARSDITIAFVLGQEPVPSELEAAIAAEDVLYGDLIVGNSIDSYTNLTLKTISMLEWTSKYCSRAPYLLKTDDDMFINVPQLLSHVDNSSSTSRTVWGRIVRKAKPVRSLHSKYYVSKHYWSDSVFPDYSTGSAYLMTADCVRPLLDAAVAPLRRYLFLEDVFTTGVLATELSIGRVLLPSFYNKKISSASHPCDISSTISVHNVRYHEQFEFWRKLLNGKSKCSS